MKISHLPIIFLPNLVKLSTKQGVLLTHADVVDAKALLVRSVTQVNPALINNTTLQYVGSATIGTGPFRY